MDTENLNLKAHLFICTQKKEGRPCCAEKDASQLRSALRDHFKATEHWGKNILISETSCLGMCEEGIVAVLYPEKKVFKNLRVRDKDKLIQELEKRLD